MGCNKDKIEKFLLISFVVMLIVTAITPTVMAATEEGITITFDPSGTIDIDVSPNSSGLGPATANSWTNTSSTLFTLYNNGTTAMDTQIKTNATTDSGNMSLDTDGASIPADNYSLNTTGLSNSTGNWITDTYSVEFDTNLAASDSETFGLNLKLADISQDWGQETTTVYFQGSIAD